MWNSTPEVKERVRITLIFIHLFYLKEWDGWAM